MYVGFAVLKKAYDRVNREALWQVLRMYDVGGKLLNRINDLYINSLTSGRVNGGVSKCFRIHFNVYMDAMIKVKMGMGRRDVKLPEEGRECTLPIILYAVDLVLCGV